MGENTTYIVMGLDDWLTAHQSITLVDLQIDAQNSCLFTYNTFIKTPLRVSSTQLRRRPPEDEQGNARNMYSILISVLYVNKQEFCASSWRSTKIVMGVLISIRNSGKNKGHTQVSQMQSALTFPCLKFI
jgi:hypothetical protein